jgi:hypothetical protein
LVVYALAFASRTRLPVKALKCAWFDEKDYFEFFPLQAVKAKSAQAWPETEVESSAILQFRQSRSVRRVLGYCRPLFKEYVKTSSRRRPGPLSSFEATHRRRNLN